MAMTRIDFEKSYFNPENRLVRRAFLMQALANGPDWRQWAQAGRTGTVPCGYNDLLFVACYGFYRNSPTRNRALMMRDFLWARGATDSGYLIDPIHQTSEARKKAAQTVVASSGEHKKAEDAAQIPGSVQKVYIGDAVSTNIYAQVYTEMWVPNGSMRAFVGSADLGSAVGLLGANVSTIKSDTVKSDWIDNFVKRFGGESTLSMRYGKTFDADFLGLTGNDEQKWKVGRRPGRVAMGGHRG